MRLFITFILSLLLFWGCSSSKKPQWTKTTIATGNVNRPTIAIDSTNGKVYVAWIGTKDTVSNVYLSYLKPGNTAFSVPIWVNSIPGNADMVSQSPPQVAVSPAGLVYVTWLKQTEVKGRYWPDLDLYIARSGDGGRTFASGVLIDNPSFPASQGFHNMAVGPKGTVYVSWLDSRAKGPSKEMGMKMDDHSMSGMEEESKMQIRVARSTDHAKSFAPGKIVAKHICQCCRTAITVSNNGDVYVAWRHIFGDNIRDMAVARSTNAGDSYSDLVRVHNDGWHINGCPHDGPSIAVNNRGEVFIIWFTGVDGKAGVYIAKAEGPDLNFGKPILLAHSEGTAQVAATVSKNGDFWFAWENPAKGTIKIGNYINGKLNKSFDTINHGRLPSIVASNKKMAVTYLNEDSVQVRAYDY